MRVEGRTRPRLPLIDRYIRRRGTQTVQETLRRRMRAMELARQQGGTTNIFRMFGGAAAAGGAGGGEDIQQTLAIGDDATGENLLNLGQLSFNEGALLTIDGAGAITITDSYHKVQGAGGGADNLDTINGAVSNQFFIIQRAAGVGAVTVRHGVGNILIFGNANVVLDDDHDAILCLYDPDLGPSVIVFAAGGGAGGGYDTIEDEGVALVQRTTLDVIGGLVRALDDGAETELRIGFQPDMVTDLFVTSNAAPHLLMGGAAKSVRIDDRLGVDALASAVGPTSQDLHVGPFLPTYTVNHNIAQFQPTLPTIGANNLLVRGVQGLPVAALLAGRVGLDIRGLLFGIGATGDGNIDIADMCATIWLLSGFNGIVADLAAFHASRISTVTGSGHIKRTFGLLVENQWISINQKNRFGSALADPTLNVEARRLAYGYQIDRFDAGVEGFQWPWRYGDRDDIDTLITGTDDFGETPKWGVDRWGSTTNFGQQGYFSARYTTTPDDFGLWSLLNAVGASLGAMDADGRYFRKRAAAMGNEAGIASRAGPVHARQLHSTFKIKMKIPSWADVRYFCGYGATASFITMLGADNPATDHAGIQVPTGRANTNFWFVSRVGAAQTAVDSGIAPVQGQAYYLLVSFNNDAADPELIFEILDNTHTRLVKHVFRAASSNMPAAATALNFFSAIEAQDTNKDIYHYYGECRNRI